MLRKFKEDLQYLSIQQKKGLETLVKQTLDNLDKTFQNLVLQFEKNGFEKKDLLKYIKIMKMIENQEELTYVLTRYFEDSHLDFQKDSGEDWNIEI